MGILSSVGSAIPKICLVLGPGISHVSRGKMENQLGSVLLSEIIEITNVN